MTARTEFWWATVHGNDCPEVVEVRFDDGKPTQVDLVGTDNYICPCDFERCQVRLIERVLPAGRAAAVDALADAMWQLLDDMGAEGTSVSFSAKAQARIAYEPFRVGADGKEAPIDYPLEEAESTLECVREEIRALINRPVKFLPWSLEPISPLIVVEDEG